MTEDPPPTMHDDHDPDLSGLHPGDDLLFDYVEQATGPTVSARITEHLAVCAVCRELVELAAIAAAHAPHRAGTLEAMPAEASARVAKAVDAEFTQHQQRRAKAKRLTGNRFDLRRWLAVGAASLAVIVGVVVIGNVMGSKDVKITSADQSANSTSGKKAGTAAPATAGTGSPAAADKASGGAAVPGSDATRSKSGLSQSAGAGATTPSSAGAGVTTPNSGSIEDLARSLQASPFPNTDAAGDVIAYGSAGTDASTAVADVLVPARLPCVVTLVVDGTGVLVGTRLAEAPNVSGATLPFFPNIAVICRNDAAQKTMGPTTKAPVSPFSLEQVPASKAGTGTD